MKRQWGVLSFADFSLDKQRKVSRRPALTPRRTLTVTGDETGRNIEPRTSKKKTPTDTTSDSSSNQKNNPMPTRRIHIALSTQDLEATVIDYTNRLGVQATVIVPGEYALWRTDCINLSVRRDTAAQPGALRHLGWEDPEAAAFGESTDVNGIPWEHFTKAQQLAEIDAIWPGNGVIYDETETGN
jgi:hypothetical protein